MLFSIPAIELNNLVSLLGNLRSLNSSILVNIGVGEVDIYLPQVPQASQVS
jgi:hypothetical protein